MKKQLYPVGCSVMVLLLAGCATTPPPPTVVVNPLPGIEGADPKAGYVEVFNGTQSAPLGDFYHQYSQTGCRIYDESGKQVAFVPAQDTNSVNAPPIVAIPAGHYRIVAESKTRGEVTIPLVIKSGRTAVVNLGVE